MIPLLFSLLASAVVPLTPEHADVRNALAQGDVDGAAALLAADPAGATAPGLLFRVRNPKDPAAACDVVKGLLGSGLAEVARVHVAACAPSLAVLRALAAGPFRHDPRALSSANDFVRQNLLLPSIDVDAVLAAALDAPLSLSLAPQRRAAAGALLTLTTRGSPATQGPARLRLIDELPEQPEAKSLTPVDDDDRPARRLQRAAVLEKLHNNDDVVAALADRVPPPTRPKAVGAALAGMPLYTGFSVEQDCQAALLVGKAERSLRHYAKARAALANATKPGCGEARKKAQYLEARVAKVQGGGGAEKLLANFVTTWGTDPLVDDVLLWLSEVRQAKGDGDGADKALRAIVTEHPGGDMADEARFRLGLRAAKANKTAEAVKLLDDAVLALRAAERPRIDLLDRARYWRARLGVFPQVESLTPRPSSKADKVSFDADVAALQAFAVERGASFYGFVAHQLLRSVDEAALSSTAAGEPRSAAALSMALPLAWEKDPRAILARAALQQGFDDDAAVLIAALTADSSDPSVVFAGAALLVQAGRPELAHQSARNAGFSQLDGRPAGDELVRWSLAWPRAHAAALDAAARAQEVPPPLLMGLAREESAFAADVVSWAGAVGLCQLMVPTAKDEALALKRPSPSTSDLVDPTLNALLGAAHLGRRLRGLSHPLLAIGAYNAGPGMVATWMPPKGRKRPLDAFVEDIPVDETRGYIKRVTGSWITYAVLDGGYDDIAFDLWIKG